MSYLVGKLETGKHLEKPGSRRSIQSARPTREAFERLFRFEISPQAQHPIIPSILKRESFAKYIFPLFSLFCFKFTNSSTACSASKIYCAINKSFFRDKILMGNDDARRFTWHFKLIFHGVCLSSSCFCSFLLYKHWKCALSGDGR